MSQKKICTVCKAEKELGEFYFDKKWNRYMARCKECRKQYNRDHADQIRANNKRCRDKNREKIRQQGKESYWRNKALHLWQQAKRNRRGINFDLKKSDIVIPEKCPILNVPFDKGRYAPSLDRWDNDIGYIKENIWVISKLANTMKNDASFAELRMFCNRMMPFLSKRDDIVQTLQQCREAEDKEPLR